MDTARHKLASRGVGHRQTHHTGRRDFGASVRAGCSHKEAVADGHREQMNGTFFATAKADLEQGISEVLNARDTLRDHYGALFIQQPAAPKVYQCSGGSDSSIVGMLQVIESSTSQNVAELFDLEEPVRGRPPEDGTEDQN